MIEQKNACLYIRVSTHDQEELSPDAQQRLLLDYCKKNNLSVIKEHIFTEKGISGKNADKRPEFMRMIGMAKSSEHPFDVILVWKYSRFARNQEESIVYKAMLKKIGIDVISVSEPTIDGPFGSLIERIIEWMDEYYSIRLSGEVIRGMTENAMRGGYNAQPPLGYRTNPATHIPEPYEPEVQIYNAICRELRAGKSLLEISRYLNSCGYTTRRGGKYEQRTVRYIIENPFYYGAVRWNRQDSLNHSIRDSSEWIISEGKHTPLITKEGYDELQNILKSISRPYKARGTSGIKHWLSGIVKCSSCGASLVSNSLWKGNSSSYQCQRYGKGQCGDSHYVKTTYLEKGIYEALEQILAESCAIQYDMIDSSNTNTDERRQIVNALSKISEKEKRIKQAYRDGIDTLDEYRENKEILNNEKSHLEKQLKEWDNNSNSNINNSLILQNVRNVYDIITNESNDKLTRANAIRSIVSKIVYDKENESLSIFLKHP